MKLRDEDYMMLAYSQSFIGINLLDVRRMSISIVALDDGY